MARLPAQDNLEFGLTGLLIRNPGIAVSFTNGLDPPASRVISAQRLANSWNRLIKQLRANESRFSKNECEAIAATMLHIQGALGLIGLRPAEKEIQASWQDLEGLMSNASALRTLLEIKRNENPNVPEFKKLVTTARVLDEDARRLAPVAPARQLAKHAEIPENPKDRR